MLALAKGVVKEANVSNKLVALEARGAPSAADALRIAETIAHSPLVKTALFGEDANWGRIIAALGRSGAEFEQNRVDILFDDVLMVRDGLGQGAAAEEMATGVLLQKKFVVTVDLKAGAAAAEIYTCDLSVDYIKINADYRS